MPTGPRGTLRDWLRLVRAPLAPTAALDAVAGLALARAAAGCPLADVPPGDWALLLLTSLAVYVVGMVGNDLADRERDRKLAPARPLPSGRVSARAAGALLGAGVALALGLGGGPSGSRWAVGGALVAALLYDGLLKRFLVPGAVALGLARAANAATGVLPLVLAGAAPWTALLAPLAVGLYAAGVTVWSTTEEVDSTARRVVARVLAASGFLGSGLLPWQVAGRPTLSAVLAFGAVSSIAFARTPRPGPPRRQVLEMLLGLYFLSGGLLTAGDGGSLAANLAGIGGAFGLIYLSQRMVRALR